MADRRLTELDRKVLRSAARNIDRNADALRACCTITHGREVRWDSPDDLRVYAREKLLASQLRAIAKTERA